MAMATATAVAIAMATAMATVVAMAQAITETTAQRCHKEVDTLTCNVAVCVLEEFARTCGLDTIELTLIQYKCWFPESSCN